MNIKIGDEIRDVEDGDCYYEGVVVSINPFMYEITRIFWNGEDEAVLKKQITPQKWWDLEVFKNNEWVKVN